MAAAAALVGDDLARQTSSRSWRSSSVREMWNAPDVFQRSGRQSTAADDEEELKWAAIERLPTYDRMRRGMLTQVMSNGRVMHEEVDVTKLGTQDKKQLMESILKVVEEDNEKFLQRLRARNDRFFFFSPFFLILSWLFGLRENGRRMRKTSLPFGICEKTRDIS